jgi:hypothetical protein
MPLSRRNLLGIGSAGLAVAASAALGGQSQASPPRTTMECSMSMVIRSSRHTRMRIRRGRGLLLLMAQTIAVAPMG